MVMHVIVNTVVVVLFPISAANDMGILMNKFVEHMKDFKTNSFDAQFKSRNFQVIEVKEGDCLWIPAGYLVWTMTDMRDAWDVSRDHKAMIMPVISASLMIQHLDTRVYFNILTANLDLMEAAESDSRSSQSFRVKFRAAQRSLQALMDNLQGHLKKTYDEAAEEEMKFLANAFGTNIVVENGQFVRRGSQASAKRELARVPTREVNPPPVKKARTSSGGNPVPPLSLSNTPAAGTLLDDPDSLDTAAQEQKEKEEERKDEERIEETEETDGQNDKKKGYIS